MDSNDNLPGTEDILYKLGYNPEKVPIIRDELEKLFKEIDFDNIKKRVILATKENDTQELISALHEIMVSLEDKGFYRPDYPAPLIRLLVNGLDHGDEDIFITLIRSKIPESEKMNDVELLASCAAITQLGYIILSRLVPDIKAATSGPHVFLLIKSYSPGSMVFVDFSIDSIKEIDVDKLFEIKENNYHLKDPGDLDEKTLDFIKEYYSSFRVIENIGLNHNIHNNLGIILDRLERYEEAILEFQKALELDPGYNDVRNNLAVTFFRMERTEESIKQLEETIKIDPACAEAHSNLGNIYAHSGRWTEALKEMGEAIKLKPGFAGAHNNLGNIYAEQEKTEEALIEFQEAIRLDPDNPLSHNNLGNMLAGLGNHEEAVREFETALELNPEFTEAYQGAGNSYYELGNFNRAVLAWVNAVHLEPDLMDSVPDKLELKVRMGLRRRK